MAENIDVLAILDAISADACERIIIEGPFAAALTTVPNITNAEKNRITVRFSVIYALLFFFQSSPPC
jgi:hypothetical protein